MHGRQRRRRRPRKLRGAAHTPAANTWQGGVKASGSHMTSQADKYLLILGIPSYAKQIPRAMPGYSRYAFHGCSGNASSAVPDGFFSQVCTSFGSDFTINAQGTTVNVGDSIIVSCQDDFTDTLLQQPAPACDVLITNSAHGVSLMGAAAVRKIFRQFTVFVGCECKLPGAQVKHFHGGGAEEEQEASDPEPCACVVQRVIEKELEDVVLPRARVPASCVVGPRPPMGTECTICMAQPASNDAQLECARCSCIMCASCVASTAIGKGFARAWSCPSCRLETDITSMPAWTEAQMSELAFCDPTDAMFFAMRQMGVSQSRVSAQKVMTHGLICTHLTAAAKDGYADFTTCCEASYAETLMAVEGADVVLVGEWPEAASRSSTSPAKQGSGMAFVRTAGGWRNKVGAFSIYVAREQGGNTITLDCCDHAMSEDTSSSSDESEESTSSDD